MSNPTRFSAFPGDPSPYDAVTDVNLRLPGLAQVIEVQGQTIGHHVCALEELADRLYGPRPQEASGTSSGQRVPTPTMSTFDQLDAAVSGTQLWSSRLMVVTQRLLELA